MFKALIGKGHHEFSTAKQQDALEFLSHLLGVVSKAEKANGTLSTFPGKIFEYKLATKMQCQTCLGVKYSDATSTVMQTSIPIDTKDDGPDVIVDFDRVLSSFSQQEIVDYNCPNCKKTTQFTKQFMFETFPKVLVMVVNRFVCPDWVPKKLECSVNVPTHPLSLDHLKVVRGYESELPNIEEKQTGPTIDQSLLNELLSFGFGENQAKNALVATDNASLEIATNWIIENMDNPAAHEPLPQQSGSNDGINPESVAYLESMGFTSKQAKNALKNCNSDVERAVDYLFSHPEDEMEIESAPEVVGEDGPSNYQLHGVVTHLGASVHSGHYVAHIFKNNECVLYNDIKVAASSDPPLGKGYIYFFIKLN